jgi:hypothetical protein
MKIEVKEINPRPTQQYPYTHRVEVFAAADKVSAWLKENKIAHTQTGWGVYYLGKDAVEWLMLRWS